MRKRPLSVIIPPEPADLSNWEPNFQAKVSWDVGEGCAVVARRGEKAIIEDGYKIVIDSPSNQKKKKKKGFYGVYDGHGRRSAMEFVKEKLHVNLLRSIEECEHHEKLDALKSAYLKTDQEFITKDVSGGACCVTALVDDVEIIISNVGDCRAVVCRSGVAKPLTTDHVASREDERERIEQQGGYVDFCHGAWRVQGTLAVTRSIGDVHSKKWVIAEPDSTILALERDMEFLVLASDGLWDKVSNQEAVDSIMSSLKNRTHSLSNENDEPGDDNMKPLSGKPRTCTRSGHGESDQFARVNSLSTQNLQYGYTNGFGREKHQRPLKKTRTCKQDSLEDEDEFDDENVPPENERQTNNSNNFVDGREFGVDIMAASSVSLFDDITNVYKSEQFQASPKRKRRRLKR